MAAELNYELEGPEDAPVVVFTGSLGTDITMWQPQSNRLRARFRTLRYDIRGHGRSEVPQGPYSMDGLGSDLVALLDRLGIERAFVCGLSIGGMISMWVGANAPERVERLVLCCTSARLGPPEAWHERAAAVRADGVEAVADAVLGRWFTPAFREAHPEAIERMRGQLTATPREGYASCCEAIAAMDLTPDLQLDPCAHAGAGRRARSVHAARARSPDCRADPERPVRGRLTRRPPGHRRAA